uniref:Secreted protein n=1 Tax=Ditylenchus dipsaci TaxID=166011 RepID=A0A915E917_9BILA
MHSILLLFLVITLNATPALTRFDLCNPHKYVHCDKDHPELCPWGTYCSGEGFCYCPPLRTCENDSFCLSEEKCYFGYFNDSLHGKIGYFGVCDKTPPPASSKRPNI